MEATLGERQLRAGEFAQRVEKPPGGDLCPPPAGPVTAPGPLPESKPPAAVQASKAPLPIPAVEDDWFSEWMLYGVILRALLGGAGWAGAITRSVRCV